MNAICSVCSVSQSNKYVVPVLNANITSPSVVSGSQITITSTSQIPNWTINNIGTDNSNLRILNNLSLSDNASPYAYDASANGTSGLIPTVFYVTQSVTSVPKTTTLSQLITINNPGTYNISVCIAPRKQFYSSSQYFGISFGGTNLTLTGAVSYKTGDNTLARFTNAATTQSFCRITGAWSGVAGTYQLQFRWVVEAASVDTTIMMTGVTIIKKP